MVGRVLTSVIGVVLGILAAFAAFTTVLGGLDSFYLLAQDACNYGTENTPQRTVRIAPEVESKPGDADAIDWTATGLDLYNDRGSCEADGLDPFAVYLTPVGDVFETREGLPLRVQVGDFDLPAEVGNPTSIWYNVTHVWFGNGGMNPDIRPYNVDTFSFGTALNTDLVPYSLWSDGTTMWYTTDRTGGPVLARTIATGLLDPGKSLALTSAQSIWSNGTTLWVGDVRARNLIAYRLSDMTPNPAQNFDAEVLRTAGNTDFRDIWSDGHTM